MSAPKICFLFDFISPYAFLAWTQIHDLAARNGAIVEPTPILFAALLNAYGHKGPAEIPPKRVYIFKDVLRHAHRLGVHLEPPPAHPFNPLLALRVASLPMSDVTRRALIDGLFAAAWGGGGGVTDPTRVAAIATIAGLDGERAVVDATSEAVKASVRASTDAALAAGAFGVPTMIAERSGGASSELFWGLDAFDHLDRFMRGEDPIDDDALARWADLPASAHRTGA